MKNNRLLVVSALGCFALLGLVGAESNKSESVKVLADGDQYVLLTSSDSIESTDSLAIGAPVSEKAMGSLDCGVFEAYDATFGVGSMSCDTAQEFHYSDNTITIGLDPIGINASGDVSVSGEINEWTITLKSNGATVSIGDGYLLKYDKINDKFCVTNSSDENYEDICIYKYNSMPGTDELYALEVTGTPTYTEYIVGDEFNIGGLEVYGDYTLSGEDQIVSPDDVVWTITPEVFTEESDSTSVTVIASIGEISSEPYVINNIKVTVKILSLTRTVEDFPSYAPPHDMPDTAWVNENGYRCAYMPPFGGIIRFEDSTHQKFTTISGTTVLTKQNNNYVYHQDNVADATFIMKDGKLVGIQYSHINDDFAAFDGTYKPHQGTLIEAVAATETSAGHLEYYHCEYCDKYFADKDCTVEITDLTAWLAEGGDGYVAPVVPQPAPEAPTNEGLSGGEIAGISVGAVAGVSLLTYVGLFIGFVKTKKAPKFLVKSFESILKLFTK